MCLMIVKTIIQLHLKHSWQGKNNQAQITCDRFQNNNALFHFSHKYFYREFKQVAYWNNTPRVSPYFNIGIGLILLYDEEKLVRVTG